MNSFTPEVAPLEDGPGGPRRPESTKPIKDGDLSPEDIRLRNDLDAMKRVVGAKPNDFLSHIQVRSEKSKTNEATGTTQCSGTAGENFSKNVNIRVPRADSAQLSLQWYLENDFLKTV